MRITIMRTVLVAAVLVLPLLVMDGAAAEVNCEERPDHPICTGGGDEEPPGSVEPGGYPCEQEGFDQASHDLAFAGGGFSFTLTDRDDNFCVDVMSDSAARWHVTVTGAGARSMALIPRDAWGGESCGGVSNMRVELPLVQELPAYEDNRFDTIPESLVNACGVEIGEWLDTDGDGTLDHLEMTQTGEPHPLAFLVFMSGRRDTSVTVTVDCSPAVCTAP